MFNIIAGYIPYEGNYLVGEDIMVCPVGTKYVQERVLVKDVPASRLDFSLKTCRATAKSVHTRNGKTVKPVIFFVECK